MQSLLLAGAVLAVAAPVVAAAEPTQVAPAANSFNPQISLILSGGYTRTRQDPANWTLAGLPMPADAEAGPGSRGFNLGESELGLAANIDPWWRGVAAIALHGDDAVSVEEAYVQSTALGRGLTLKAGRFLSGVGYLNERHAHTWDFADNPLAYQALLGTQYGDDGVQLRWLAPTDRFLELGVELGRGRGFPGSDTARNGAGMAGVYAHTGDDLGDSHSWRAGVSLLQARATDQALTLAGTDAALGFTGRTRVWVVDGVWKWAPQGNATRTSFTLQGEWMRATREGQLAVDNGGASQTGAYRVNQGGWYVQGVYQFAPGWRVGLRTEALEPGTPRNGEAALGLPVPAGQPRKQTAMLDFKASEFSLLRLQWAADRSRGTGTDHQLQLQYQMSLGAHGAHSF